MREQGAFFIVALAFVLGVLGFWSLRIVDALRAPSSFAQESPRGLVFPLPQSPEVTRREVFLAPLEEKEIANLRDIFSFAQGYEVLQGEVLPLPEEEAATLSEEGEETLPPVTLKGVVMSSKNQVVVVEVGGEIFFLTPAKPLSGELRLVKVDKKQVVLTYQGREFVFSLEE